MRTFNLTDRSNAVLRRDLHASNARECTDTAWVLAHIGEFDERKLYLEDGYTSMRAYCVDELHYSEDAAYKRIQAARVARQFPILFEELADGRLHLTGLNLLAPHLTPENASELIAGATHKSKADIQRLLAERFPRTEPLALVQPLPPSTSTNQLAPAQVRPHVEPIAPGRYELTFAVDQEAYDALQYAQSLMSRRARSGGTAEVFARAVRALVVELEKRKFGKNTTG